jgi:hypothetical protein
MIILKGKMASSYKIVKEVQSNLMLKGRIHLLDLANLSEFFGTGFWLIQL